jgi:hypothetical protein
LEASTSPVGAAISVDANNDGRIDGTDADGDGVRSTVDAINGFGAAGQTPVNTDSPALGNTLGSDALPDYIDIDSDNDAIPDQIEGLSTPGYRLPSCIDADCDGMDDIYELPLADQGACPGANAGMGGITTNTFGNKVVISTDTDGIPDYRDTDSDNDGASDLAEATVSTSLPNGLAPATSVIADIDADGLSDLIDSYNRLTGTDPCCNNTNQYFGNNGGNNTGSCFGSSTRIGGGGTRSWRNGGVLPVDVIEFTGVYNNSIATLSWLVANEINLARYEVERSTDGVNFSTVGTVAAANAGSYRLNDNLSNISVAVVYYRLRSVDRDGSMKLSRVIPIRLASKIGGSIVISPNPANTYFVLTVKAAKDSKANIRVVDASGKVVIVDNRSLATGTNTITYSNIAGLAQGLYTVQVIVEGELQSQKLVVAH